MKISAYSKVPMHINYKKTTSKTCTIAPAAQWRNWILRAILKRSSRFFKIFWRFFKIFEDTKEKFLIFFSRKNHSKLLSKHLVKLLRNYIVKWFDAKKWDWNNLNFLIVGNHKETYKIKQNRQEKWLQPSKTRQGFALATNYI